MPKREGILILPEGVVILPLHDPQLLHETLAEILGEHPNTRRDIQQTDGASKKSPGGKRNDGSSTPSKR
jgi:hypothetical protein